MTIRYAAGGAGGGGFTVMEQLPYCLHNSRWNSTEFVGKGEVRRDAEAVKVVWHIATLPTKRLTLLTGGIRYRSLKLENFIPVDSVKCLYFLPKINL